MNLESYVKEKQIDISLQALLQDLAQVGSKIAEAMKVEVKGYTGSENASAEKQLKMDVVANDLFVSTLQRNSVVSLIASEELEEALLGKAGEEGYSVAFDPLDGSSLADVNLSVGSIIGIYKGKNVIGRTGREQVAAMIFVYGPRLTCMLTVGKGVDEFTFDFAQKDFILTTAHLLLKEEAKMFAPGNLRACSSESWYVRMMEYWLKQGYTLRYSGGMVPDVNQILKKNGGVFTYPGYKDQPKGKLRLLYECSPIAFLIEQAGGIATDGQEAILDLKIEELHQRTPIFLGSKKEVARVMEYKQKF